MKALSSRVICWRSAGVLNAACSPHGMYIAIRVTRPVYVIIRWNGSPNTDTALCASSQERWPLPQRKVKKSMKIFLCVITPLTMATSMNIAAAPASQRPQSTGR